jgi:hypothetical protein
MGHAFNACIHSEVYREISHSGFVSMVNLGRNPQLLLDVIGNFWYLSPLHSKCSTIKNKCSRTQRPHTVLAGRDSSGCFWTLQAQPYPWLFAEVVAANAAIALQA